MSHSPAQAVAVEEVQLADHGIPAAARRPRDRSLFSGTLPAFRIWHPPGGLMLRTISAALLAALSMVAVVAPGCTSEKACAYGPSELRDVSLSVSAGAPINGTIDYGDINGSEFTAVSAYDAPAGVQLSLFDSGVKVDGSVATAGTYGFEVLVEAEEGNVCAPWARYDVTLTVK